MYSSQQQQEATSFNDERAEMTSELHTIVDNLQPDPPPQVAPSRRPFWQRTGVWQVPLCLIALTIILMYNPRVDNCNGFKITYKQKVLCISNDADFFLFVENFVCDFIESDKSVMDSLVADEAASDKMKAYFEKYDFSIEKQPIKAEVLRGMRGQYDSTSFCKNFSKACWNAGIRLLNEGKNDSACYYFNKIEVWSWRDSVLTAADKSVISRTCYADFPQNQVEQKAAFQEDKQDAAKGLNTINNKLRNVNDVFQNRINKMTNRGKLLDKNAKNNVNKPTQQDFTPIAPPTKPDKTTGLPITLYFDNDSPEPRSNAPTTRLDYGTTYAQYYNKKEDYPQRSIEESQQIAAFFNSHIRFGYQNLVAFSDSLIAQLNKGEMIEISLSSSTFSADDAAYNKNLASRQINAVVNHFNRYKAGVLKRFILSEQLKLRVILYESNSYNKSKSINSIEAMRERKVVIQEIGRSKYNKK